MNPFIYSKPADSNTAQQLYKKNTAPQYIAGGTNLLDLMKKDIAAPSILVDINNLPFKSIVTGSEGISIGALSLNSDVAAHPDVVALFPLVSKALLAGASPQLRNMATIGGNLLQRTRCPYFYDIALPCNKRIPGTGCGAMEGLNRSAALFGTSSECVAVHPSDLCIALAALDAVVHIQLNGKETRIPFKDFHRLPGDNPGKDNNLPAGALVTRVTVPANQFNTHFHYLKIRDRASYAFALVSVAAGLQLSNDKIISARLAAGGVAHKPWRLYEAEQFLAGKKATEENFKQAAAIAVKDAKPLKHNGFKIKLLNNGIQYALKESLEFRV
jgi:xanthine dehydrogenase YagS FAD-binding subunit